MNPEKALASELSPLPTLIGRDGIWVWANQAAASLLRLATPDAVAGEAIKSVIPGLSMTDASAWLKADSPRIGEVICGDGARRQVSITARFRDDTLYVWLEEQHAFGVDDALERVEENFRRIFEVAPCGLMLVDEDGTIMTANTMLASIFGYELADLVGQELKILIPPQHQAHHGDYRRSYMKDPDVRTMGPGRDVAGVSSTGAEIPVEIALSPLRSTRSGGAQARTTLAVVVDISERKATEAELSRAHHHLEEFTYVASHDLKAPLRGIMHLAEWISEDLTDDAPTELRANLSRIRDRARRMNEMINNLLEYARAGVAATEPEQIIIADMISDMIALVAPPEGFMIETDIKPRQLFACRTPLESALRNLITNAIKHHPGTDGHLLIKVRRIRGTIRFDLIDNGPGIPDYARDQLFRLFYSNSQTQAPGQGIGLSIAKRAAEAHGGGIYLAPNQPAQGAHFVLRWPAVHTPRKSAPLFDHVNTKL